MHSNRIVLGKKKAYQYYQFTNRYSFGNLNVLYKDTKTSRAHLASEVYCTE